MTSRAGCSPSRHSTQAPGSRVETVSTVHHQHRRAGLPHVQPQPFGRVEDQGPVEEHVGRDRGHHDGPQPGGEHRAPGREVVGGGSGRRGHQQPVGGVGHEGPVVDEGGDAHGVARHGLLHRGLVEGGALGGQRCRRGAWTETERVIRSSTWWVPDRKAASASSSPAGSTGVRYPSRPMLTPSTGMPPGQGGLHRAEQRAVPAQADQQVGPVGRGRAVGTCRAGTARWPCSASQAGGPLGQGGGLGPVRVGVEGDDGHGPILARFRRGPRRRPGPPASRGWQPARRSVTAGRPDGGVRACTRNSMFPADPVIGEGMTPMMSAPAAGRAPRPPRRGSGGGCPGPG